MKVSDFENDRLLRWLVQTIHVSIRLLAVLMTALIAWGVVDVVYVLYQKVIQPPYFVLEISDILKTFGAFMAVLIAIEIFVNITSYLRENVIHVKIVMATALMAVARKVIVLDFKAVTPEQMFALAAVVLATSIGYWIAVILDRRTHESPEDLTE